VPVPGQSTNAPALNAREEGETGERVPSAAEEGFLIGVDDDSGPEVPTKNLGPQVGNVETGKRKVAVHEIGDDDDEEETAVKDRVRMGERFEDDHEADVKA
jgi:hypothetical protein